ncbi:MAG: hypothetical protein KDE27_30470, partial [Planctomycetes bacterium]|nr:hypothetical protein [Planctomycetota bacterium]
VALLAFAALTTIDYTLTDTPTSYFLHALFVLALILVASLLLDWRNRRNPRERLTPYLWPIVDCAGLTWVLSDGDGLRSPLVMLYPLLVLVTGFWLDTRVILATTATAMTGYGWLIAQPRPWGALRVDLSQHLVVYTTLLVTGVILSLQVARARALRDYTTNRR